MFVLIVGSNPDLSLVWQGHLSRQGLEVVCVASQDDAIATLQQRRVDVLVLDLLLVDGSPLAVADFASYRQPETRVIPVTRQTFFSDGSIFSHMPNACTFVSETMPPEDLAAIVEHYGTAR